MNSSLVHCKKNIPKQVTDSQKPKLQTSNPEPLNPKPMKRIIVLLAVIALAACGRPAADSVTVTGRVENPTAEMIEVFYYKDFITNEMKKVEVPLDDNNRFEAVLPLNEATDVFVSIPRRTHRMYLQPGAVIDVSFDAEDPDNIPVFAGDNARESSFIFAFRTGVGFTHSQSAAQGKMRELPPTEFIEYATQAYLEKGRLLEEYQDEHALDPSFVSLFKTDLLYEKYSNLMQYGSFYHFLHQGEDVPELPDDYFEFVEDAIDFKDEYTRARSYFGFLNHYLNYYTTKHAEEDDDRSRNKIQFELAQDIFSGKSRDMMLARIVSSALSFGSFEEALALYESFAAMDVSDNMASIVQDAYDTALLLAPGMPAPGFELTDLHGETVALEDFHGQVVYLDFWASWCGPCIQQIPHAKELKKRMADHDDLVFLYISVDTDEEAWRKAIEDHEIKGVHVNVNGFDHEVPASYSLRGVPTFYVIGRDGMIFDNRPPRPSEERIDEVLLSALNNAL